MKEYILNEKLKTQVEQHSSHKEKIEYDLKKLEDYLLLLNDKIEILKKLLSEKQAVTTTKTQKELDFEQRVKKWRNKTKDLTIAPFNSDQWSVV